MALKSLKFTPEENAKNSPSAISSPGDKPAYPYGTRICLDDSSLKKLGISNLPPVGTKMTVKAIVEVCSTSEYDSVDGGARMSLDLQVTDIELGKAKNDVDPEKIYDKK